MDKLVTIATLDHIAQADLCRLKLEEDGIKAFVADGGIVTMNWFLANAVGGIKVQVLESDAVAALAIIEQLRFDVDEDEDTGGPNKKIGFWKCANCGERVEWNFGICWNCQHPGPAV